MNALRRGGQAPVSGVELSQAGFCFFVFFNIYLFRLRRVLAAARVIFF